MSHQLFLTAGVVVAVIGLLLRRRSEAWGKGLVIAGCLGCMATLLWQIRESLFTPEAGGPDRGQAVVAYFLANEFLRHPPASPGTVRLLFPPGSVIDEEARGTYAGTFNRVLRPFGEFKTEVLVLSVPDKAAKAGNIPLQTFQAAATNAPGCVACVSFAGVPADIARMLSNGPRPAPSMFVFDPWGTTNWVAALRSGLIQTVIVPKPGAVRDAEVSGEPNAVFERLYLMANPATADRIASQLNHK